MIVYTCTNAACLLLAISGAVEAVTAVPPLESMPLSLTSYWMFDDDGQPVAWGGQANDDPGHYANGEVAVPEHAGNVAACIQDWTLFYWTTAVSFTWQGQQMQVSCYDNFGAESYRRPFFHDGYDVWVVPVDILSPVPFHGLVWEWSTDTVKVGE